MTPFESQNGKEKRGEAEFLDKFEKKNAAS